MASADAAPSARDPLPSAQAAKPAAARTVPAGVSPQQWAQLERELGTGPAGQAELERLAGYFGWADDLRRFRAARTAGADAAELRPLALAVDAGLAQRLHEREISAAEARQIKIAILEATVSAPEERAPALQRWLAAQTTLAQPDPRQAGFEQRQAAIVAAWSAEPAESRDRARLERELDVLRSAAFGAAPRN